VINFGSLEDLQQGAAELKILVIGCGGGGCNSVHRLTSIGIQGVKTIAINTDKSHLRTINADQRLLIGSQVTRGLGAGGIPEVGEGCMENALGALNNILQDADLTFITAGLGGGTGTGVAPVVAREARRHGSLVVSMATTPFQFERGRRMEAARWGIGRLNDNSDMMLLLDNNRLMDMVNHLPIEQGFGVMDQLISEMIKGLVEAVTLPSLVNIDFNDLRTIMRHKGVSTILYGESTDPDGAVREALGNPLLEIDYEGATGALIHVTGGEKLSVRKVTKVLEGMSEQLDPEAQVIFGARVDPSYKDLIRVMAVITGIQGVGEKKGRRSHEREELVNTIEELVDGRPRRRSPR
jgi:cell division protein FtsZ